ncbi:MAG TPA: JAB N-terminal domain-containing protein [Streptosporangiaceae bacterium]|nr:JAB N-terminal domain-containing protein [Streptosporangiaceae bacterium]
MTVQVELYRSADYIGPEHQPLVPLLRDAFEAILGRSLERASFMLNLYAIDDDEPLAGHPTLVNLRGSHGYTHVSIVDQGKLIYQHPHPVREIIATPLQRRLRTEFPEVGHWGYGLVGPGLENLMMIRPTPDIAGRIDIPAGQGRRRGVHVEELPDPDPPASSLAELHAVNPARPRGGPASNLGDEPVAIVLSRSAHRSLTQREFSGEVEEGGFLIGHRHADRRCPGRALLAVTAAVPAQSTGASLLRFTFTGESFLRLGDLIAGRGRDEQILGWYHTHLFPATPGFGLSTVDVQLHMSTFRRKWQVAALLNLNEWHRVLRFYRTDADGMTEAPFWVAEPSAGHSLPPPEFVEPPGGPGVTR